jgi:CheY-like chemotaxis protein
VKPRVLVVEDNPVNLELTIELLEQEGCEALTADSAEAALQLVVVARPDLILMDIELPGMTGYDATRQLKADTATAAIPVLALTASAMRGDEIKGREVGFDAYLTKPLDTHLFRQVLRQFLPAANTGSRRGRRKGDDHVAR